MAHIFKHPNKSNKGIIIFTHKELQLFNLKVNLRLIQNPFRIVTTYSTFKRKISKIREKYFIVFHWGFYSENQTSPEWVDFHLSAPFSLKGFIGNFQSGFHRGFPQTKDGFRRTLTINCKLD